MSARLTLPLLAALLPLVLAGCGGNSGGGGGGARTPQLTVDTDWTNYAQPTGGQSIQIELLNSSGLVFASSVVNRSSTLSSSPLGAVTPGSYHLNVQLFSGTGLTGTQVGSFDEEVQITGPDTLTVGVGNTPTKLAVTPGTASLTVQQSQQFYAEGQDALARRICLPANAVTWTQLGGVVTVSPSGIAIGASAGSGTVQAKDTAANLLAAATISVTPFNVTTSKWTILVYMNASNDLDGFSEPNFLQMQQAATNAQVRIVVQWKQAIIPGFSPNPTFVGTRRYLVTPSNGSAVTSTLIQDMGTGVDMGQAQTLNQFIAWGETYFPATRICLVVWDHGDGWQPGLAKPHQAPSVSKLTPYGVSYDEQTGNHIDVWQLPAALQAAQKLDIVAWDSSLMQMLEVGYEIQNQASYMVGSEESPPGAGYPYNLVIDKFDTNPDAATPTLAESFVDGMIQYYTTTNPPLGTNIEQSVVDLSKVGALATQVSSLGDALITNKAALGVIVPTVRANTQSYPPGDSVRIYRDAYDLGTQLQANNAPAGVLTAVTGVQSAIDSAVVYERHGSDNPNSHGLSLDFSSSSQFSPLASDYNQMTFGQNTDWSKWLAVAP